MMKRLTTLVVCAVVLGSGVGCSYHRAYVSYSKVEEDVQVAAAGWDGRRIGPVSAREGGALWEKCTAVAEGSLWVLMDDARKMGGNAVGEIRWIPRNPNRTTEDPTCRKKWGWILVWPVLATPAFQSARVEAVAYNVPDSSAAEAGLYLIPEDSSARRALAQKIVSETVTVGTYQTRD
jgi:hypothetical protein